MRPYHLYLDQWTVLDEEGVREFTVSAPDGDGKRRIVAHSHGRLITFNSYTGRTIIAAVERRKQQLIDAGCEI